MLTDSVYAKAAASSLVAAFTGIALWKTARGKPIGAIARELDGRITRTAITETSSTFSDEHEAQMRAFAKRATAHTWITAVFRVWNTSLERVCPECARHEGEITPMAMSFARGDVPGTVHPRCQCFSGLVFLPMRLPSKGSSVANAA